MNKLDLRDYLYHGYGVRVFNVRSYIKQRPIESIRPGASRVEYFRRQGVKTMTVDLAEPFVWPEKPKSWEEYAMFSPYLIVGLR
jgi:large subunit ribosomal protein L23